MDSDQYGFPDILGCTTSSSVRSILNELANSCHTVALQKGWWDAPRRSPAECIALMHAELSEALEAYRTDPKAPCDKGMPINAVEEELADVIIRVLDFAESEGLDIGKAVVYKYFYNKTRPHKHGKKF